MTHRTLLNDLFALSDLETRINDGYVTRKFHLAYPKLAILNYTPQTQYSRLWDEVTKKTRGLIYNVDTLEVLARGFDKFGNWDESGYPYPPSGSMMLSTKFDGSLGILFEANDVLHIATRGSFHSEQAAHASKVLIDVLTEDLKKFFWAGYETSLTEDIRGLLAQGMTPLFEIIYPSNRIVVDYGDEDKLVLLDVIENATGMSNIEAFDTLRWEHKADKKLIAGGFSDSLTHEIPKGEEGFVLYFPHSGFRCKMKSAEYVELHRIVTGLSKKTIWEQLGRGKSLSEIKEPLPDELYSFVDATFRELEKQRLDVLEQIQDAWDDVTSQSVVALTRKDFAQRAKKHGAVAKYLFKILDGADETALNGMIWDTLKPVGDTRAFARSEDVS